MQHVAIGLTLLLGACTETVPPLACDFDVALDAELATHRVRDCGRLARDSRRKDLVDARACILASLTARTPYVFVFVTEGPDERTSETTFGLYALPTATGIVHRRMSLNIDRTTDPPSRYRSTVSCKDIVVSSNCDVDVANPLSCLTCREGIAIDQCRAR
jgi:hypothetical protein